MATYLSVPLKRTWEVDLVKPLRTFISNTFTNADPEDYNTALTEFNKLRASIVTKSVDKHDSALEVLYRYYDQLNAIESKFPISENQIRINFKWQDAFDKESFFSGKRTLSVASASFEKVCLLFNIAALQSQVAEVQDHANDEGLKKSAKLYQQAAGIFSHLKDCVLSHVQSDPTPDLHPDTLAALSALMLAQAQDCFCRKAMADKMKPAVVAKLVHQCSDLYAEAMKLLQLQSIRDLWHKDWIPCVAMKQAAFHSLAEYSQSQVAKDAKEFGEEIARLKHAKDLMIAAETRGGYTFTFQDYYKRIDRALTDANKDNEFIYHARVPELNTLAALGKAPVAKIIPFTPPLTTKFTDLFEKVVPLAVHQAMVAVDNKKSAIVNAEVGRLREHTQLMNSALASLNLPASIEDLQGGKVPASVLEKSAKIREMGGSVYLGQLMSELPALLTRNREILEESIKMLDEEAESDRQLRTQFKERWTRTPSEKLTEPIRSEGAKYRHIIDNAIGADHIVKERYAKHKESIELLSKQDSEIAQALPSASPVAALQGSPVVQELRQLMEQVETIKAERDVIENEIKEAKCDLSSKFMTALAQDGAVNEDTISETELDRIYQPLREQVTESIHRQESVLANVQRCNDQFVAAKSQYQSAASREQKLKDLAAGYDNFVELKSNLEEGTKFYNDLTQLLVKFQSKVSDLCFARRTEKEELMKDVQNSIANQRPAPPPTTPSYQQPTVQGSSEDQGQKPKVPPARPPPPVRPPQPNGTVNSAPASAPSAPGAPSAPAPGAPAAPTLPAGGAPPQFGAAPYAGYGAPAAPPYPTYPPGGYVPPPMPQGYNPYAQYNPYPPGGQPPAYPPQQPYPGYPGYPQQQWQ